MLSLDPSSQALSLISATILQAKLIIKAQYRSDTCPDQQKQQLDTPHEANFAGLRHLFPPTESMVQITVRFGSSALKVTM